MKRWLNLPRNATQVLLYHPEVMKIPQLSTIKLKAKLTYLTAIMKSPDSLVHQLQELLVSNYVQQNLKISALFKDCFDFAISQILTTPKKNLTNKIDKRIEERCDEHLSDLKVQSKFKEITILESECNSWKKIVQSGLPHRQLSLLLRAASDFLPHPANLRRWNIQCASKCPLCSSTPPTTTHILNGCPTALQQDRFTWRHDSVSKSIFINLKNNLPA